MTRKVSQPVGVKSLNVFVFRDRRPGQERDQHFAVPHMHAAVKIDGAVCVCVWLESKPEVRSVVNSEPSRLADQLRWLEW